jgi:hypothetical protein
MHFNNMESFGMTSWFERIIEEDLRKKMEVLDAT